MVTSRLSHEVPVIIILTLLLLLLLLLTPLLAVLTL